MEKFKTENIEMQDQQKNEIQSLLNHLSSYIQSYISKKYKTYQSDNDLYQSAILAVIQAYQDNESNDIDSFYNIIKHAIEDAAKQIVKTQHSNYISGTKEQKKIAGEFFINTLDLYIRSLISKNYSSYIRDFDDIYQEAVLCILINIPKYDAEMGALTTFFTPYINQGIRTFIRGKYIRTSSYYCQKAFQMKKAAEIFRQKNGIEPTLEDLAIELNTSILKVLKTIKIINRATEVSFDLAEDVISMEDNVEEQLVKKEETEELIKAVNTLQKDAKEILLYWVESGSYNKTAAAFEKSIDYVKISVEDSLIQLKEILNPRFKKIRSKILFAKSSLDPELTIFF